MKYFIDTHDRTKGSWPQREVSEAEFIEIYAQFEKACEAEGGADLGAHVNVADGKAFCFTKGPDAEAIRRAHDRLEFPFDSITEVKRVTGADLRPGRPKTLLDRARLGAFELPSRVIMAPMTRMRAHSNGTPSGMMATYYAQRATAALIISEATAVSPQGIGYLNTPGLYTDEQVNAWTKITSAVHERGGRIFLQLFHAGRISHRLLQPGNSLPVAPSAVQPKGEVRTRAGRMPYETPRALSREEIPGIVAEFRHAAKLAVAAGFDGVEIHAANGYLLDQFLRSGANRREDEYGGSAANRARLLLETTVAVASETGADRTGVRLSPLHAFNDISDADPEETFRTAVEGLNGLGIAYLHVVERDDAPAAGPRFDIRSLRRIWKTAYIVNENYDRARAEAAIADGVDFVSFGKLFIANPDLPRRFQAGAPLNQADRDTFYGGDHRGYIDYPALPDELPVSAG